jgi:Flp pilus assembly protein TadD
MNLLVAILDELMGACVHNIGLSGLGCQSGCTLAGDPGNLVARHLLGAWLVNHGRAQEAIPHLEATFERTPGDVDVQTNLAIAYGIVGRTDEAERMLRDLASRPPASATVRTELGRVLLRQGRAAEALAEIEAALRDRPEDVRALLALAIAHAQLDRPEARRTAIERLLALTPATAGDLDSLGSVLHREGLLSDAESVFQSAASLAPDRADIRRNVALATWAQGKREAALLEIEAAIRLAPRYALAHFTRGQILEELGRVDDARDELAAAADLDPARVEPRLTLARLLTRAEDLDGAERELQRAVTEAPANAEARRGLALVLIGQRRLDEALTEARAALALRPDWALATGDLAWILARRDDFSPGDRAEAVTLGEAAVQTTGRRHAGTLDALAAAYAGAGDFQRAAATAEEALQLALAQRDDPFATRVARRLLAYRAGEIDRDTPR